MSTSCEEKEEIPVLLTCGCDLGLVFQYISTTQHCDLNPCGFVPGYNTGAKYNNEGDCISSASTHSPQLSNDRGSVCWPQRYLKKTTKDTSGSFPPYGSHGRTLSEEFTFKSEIDSNGFEKNTSCEYKSECSGESTTTTTFECKGGEYISAEPFCRGYSEDEWDTSTTDITILTYNNDCTVTTKTECSGKSSWDYFSTCDNTIPGILDNTKITCTATYSKIGDWCVWSGTGEYSSTFADDTTNYSYETDEPCGCFEGGSTETKTVIEPTPDCTITYDYAQDSPKLCNPQNLLEFPEYPLRAGETFDGSKVVCLADGQKVVPVPDLKTGGCRPWPNVHRLTECIGNNFVTGQGRSNWAFKFVNPYESDIVSERKVKARLSHHGGAPGYLKVWIRKVIQKYKWEDCETGFPGDPEVPNQCHKGTPSLPDCNETTDSEGRTNFDCRSRWSTDGPPEKEDFQVYEWNGNPLLKDKCQSPSSCVNYVDQEYDITAANGTTVYIEYKYSYVKNYEPNWPDVCGSQGCKPNGYPIYEEGSEKCPKYDPSKPAQCYETQLINNRPVSVCVPCNDCGPNF